MRKSFLEVKKKLRKMNIRYMLLYLAKLQVITKGKTHFFTRPEEVWDWLEMWDSVPVKTLTSRDPFFTRTKDANKGSESGA